MKRILLFAFSFFAITAFGQVNESKSFLKGEDKNALSIKLPKTEKKEVEKAWSKFIKEYDGKTKMDKRTGLIFTDNAEIEKMSSNTVDIYAQVQADGDATLLTVWYNLGGAYLNSEMHADGIMIGKNIINDFALTVSRAAIEEMLATEEEKLKELEKEEEKLKKEKKDHEDEITKYEEKIKEAKENISKNEKDQAAKQEEIEAQKKAVQVVKDRLDKVD